jgi:glucose-1-phosphate adenylyltransferase
MLLTTHNRTLVMVLAGGRGSRLMPLTSIRAKPAVPFGGRYRIVDFVLSNLVNSGFLRMVVLTQYMSQSLTMHIARAWNLSRSMDQYVEIVPAQQRTGLSWYMGSADAVYQNMNLIDDADPEYVAIFGADHIYKMNVAHFLERHVASQADVTIAAIPVPLAQAHRYGILEVDAGGRILRFDEKPSHPRPMPHRPGWALASMGNYLFRRRLLVEELQLDAQRLDSQHDFGRDILPALLQKGASLAAYDFSTNPVPGMSERERGYWRDVGTVGSYFDANMDLIAVSPVMDLYNRAWPIRTDFQHLPPAKFVHADPGRTGMATESMVCEGCIVSGGQLARCIISPRVRVNSFASVEDSILLDGVQVGRYAQLRRVIADKNAVIPAGVRVGFDAAEDVARGLTVTEDGITVIPKDRVLT